MTLPPEDRDLIEQRVRNEIQREISHETWRGLRIGSYRYKVPIPPELRGSEWDWGYCSHWSTHPGAEPLVSLFDAAQALTALLAENERLREALTAMVDDQVEYMTINKLGDPEKQHVIRAARAALNPSREVKS